MEELVKPYWLRKMETGFCLWCRRETEEITEIQELEDGSGLEVRYECRNGRCEHSRRRGYPSKTGVLIDSKKKLESYRKYLEAAKKAEEDKPDEFTPIISYQEKTT